MKFVLDASVGLKWVVLEPGQQRARQLRDEFQAGVHQLLAPDIFLVEVAHVLTKLERRREIGVNQAKLLYADVVRTGPALRRSVPLLPRALDLAQRARMGVYDCLYVALAETEQCELVTADERIAKALPDAPVRLLDRLP